MGLEKLRVEFPILDTRKRNNVVNKVWTAEREKHVYNFKMKMICQYKFIKNLPVISAVYLCICFVQEIMIAEYSTRQIGGSNRQAISNHV